MLRPRPVHPAWVISLAVCCLLASLLYFPLTKIVASSPSQIVRSSGQPLVHFTTPQTLKVNYDGTQAMRACVGDTHGHGGSGF
jgi:hypothetical protein